MFRVKYNEDITGTLDCPFCNESMQLPGNVHTEKRSGVIRTYPDAQNVIHSHFNHDKNSFIPVCTTTRMQPGKTPWQAIDERGNVVARGHVVIRVEGNAIIGPTVERDEPQ